MPLQGPKAAELVVQVCSRVIKLGQYYLDVVSVLISDLACAGFPSRS